MERTADSLSCKLLMRYSRIPRNEFGTTLTKSRFCMAAKLRTLGQLNIATFGSPPLKRLYLSLDDSMRLRNFPTLLGVFLAG